MSTDQQGKAWAMERDRAVALTGYLRFLAVTDRYALPDDERELLWEAAALIARSIGRPDLALREEVSR